MLSTKKIIENVLLFGNSHIIQYHVSVSKDLSKGTAICFQIFLNDTLYGAILRIRQMIDQAKIAKPLNSW